MATRMPQSPVTLLEQIVCDADLFMFGTDEFDKRNKLMRKEAEWRFNKKISKGEWRKSTIQLFESHHYHTDYARQLLNDQKAENLEKLQQKELEDIEEDTAQETEHSHDDKHATPTTETARLKKTKSRAPGQRN